MLLFLVLVSLFPFTGWWSSGLACGSKTKSPPPPRKLLKDNRRGKEQGRLCFPNSYPCLHNLRLSVTQQMFTQISPSGLQNRSDKRLYKYGFRHCRKNSFLTYLSSSSYYYFHPHHPVIFPLVLFSLLYLFLQLPHLSSSFIWLLRFFILPHVFLLLLLALSRAVRKRCKGDKCRDVVHWARWTCHSHPHQAQVEELVGSQLPVRFAQGYRYWEPRV